MNLKITGVILISGAFYGEMTYQKSMTPARGNFTTGATGQVRGRTGAFGANGGAVSGAILSKDASSITIKMQGGSTKVVLTNVSMAVMKTSTGTFADLIAGTNGTAIGTSNSVAASQPHRSRFVRKNLPKGVRRRQGNKKIVELHTASEYPSRPCA